MKLTDLTYDVVAVTCSTMMSTTTHQPSPTNTTITSVTMIPASTFDYQAKLKCITIKIEANLKSKLDAVIAKLQLSVETLEQKFNENSISKAMQVDKAPRENHTHELAQITQPMSYLVSKISVLVDMTHHPMPMNGTRHS